MKFNSFAKRYVFRGQGQTYEEICSWVDFLLGLLEQFDIAGNEEPRKLFVNHLKQIIWRSRRIEDVRKYLTSFNERKYFSEAYIKITKILTDSNDELEKNNPSLLGEIINLQEYLAPKENDISQLFETYVFVDDHTLYRFSKNEDDQYALPVQGFKSYEDLIDFLATEINNLDVLNQNFEKLINAQHGWVSKKYLEKLGFSSSDVFESLDSCIEKLDEINISETVRFSEFLIGIVKGFKAKSLEEYRALIDYLSSNKKFKNITNLLVIETCQTDGDFLYLSQKIKDHRIDLFNFPRISFYKHHNNITNEQFELLIDAFIEIRSLA